MAASAIKWVDGVLLFLTFSFAAAVLVAAISVLGYDIALESVLPVAALCGLSAGCFALIFNRVLDRAPATPPAARRVFPRQPVDMPAPARAPVRPLANSNRGGLVVSPDQRQHVLSFSNEMERAGRSITSG